MAFEKPIWSQNNTYSARLDRQIIASLWYEGVIDGMKVKQRAAGAQMRVQVETGSFVIYGDDQANQGAYLGQWYDDAVDANMPVIAAAPGSNSRIDLVYVRVNDPNAGGPAGNSITFGVVTGVAAASPSVPALPTSAIALAQVLVTAGNIQVVNSMITNVRSPAQLKGALPIGSVIDFAGPESAIPTDCVAAYGQAINRDTYWHYFAKVGTVHGAGDGTSTVNVPDYRGRNGIGLDNMGGVDAGRLSTANTLGLGIGAETVALIEANLPAHAHSMQNHTHTTSGTTSDQSQNHSHTLGGHVHNAFHGHTASAAGVGDHQHSTSTGYNFVGVTGGSAGFQLQAGTQTINSYGQFFTLGAGAHSHTITVDANNFNTGGPSGGSDGANVGHTHTFNAASGGPSSASTGNGNGTATGVNKMQPGIMINKIIKVR